MFLYIIQKMSLSCKLPNFAKQKRVFCWFTKVTATELIKTVTAFNGQKAELETFNSHVDEAYSTAIQTFSLRKRLKTTYPP